MEIIVDQPVSMADRKIRITVTKLPPKGNLTLRASMSFPWAPSVVFGSSVSFVADENGCVEIMDTFDKSAYPYRFEHIAYEDAGEPFYAPYIIPESIRLSMKIAPRLSFSMGGTLQGNTDAVIDSWERMLAFFLDP